VIEKNIWNTSSLTVEIQPKYGVGYSQAQELNSVKMYENVLSGLKLNRADGNSRNDKHILVCISTE
jgi:hypothetical protein